jgi:hypothetical protein
VSSSDGPGRIPTLLFPPKILQTTKFNWKGFLQLVILHWRSTNAFARCRSSPEKIQPTIEMTESVLTVPAPEDVDGGGCPATETSPSINDC